MTVTNDLLPLAKQGDTKAIAALLNRQLQPKGITARATLKGCCLHVLLESDTTPDRATLFPWIQKGIAALAAPSIETTKVYGRKTGDKDAAWTQEFAARKQPPPIPKPPVSPPVSTTTQLQAPEEPLSLKERARRGDVEAIAVLLDYAVKHKGYKVKALLKDRCLQIMVESEQVPDEETATALIRRQLTTLKPKAFEEVGLYGKQEGEEIIVWNQEFDVDAHPTLLRHTSTTHPKRIGHAKNSSFVDGQIIKLERWMRDRRIENPLVGGVLNLVKGNQNAQIGLMVVTTFLVTIGLVNTFSSNSGEPVATNPTQPSDTEESASSIQPSQVPFQGKKRMSAELRQEAQEVTDVFLALNSRLDIGMNFMEYGDEVAELKVALDRFARQEGATETSAYTGLSATFDRYEFALSVWRYCIESNTTDRLVLASSYYGEQLIREYQVTSEVVGDKSYIYLDIALSAVWTRAQQDSEQVQAQLDSMR